jgi:tRNA(Ile)-lysidine synthase
MLSSAGLSWIDDPSNELVAYERVRVRLALAGAEDDRISGTLLERGRLAAMERTDVGRRAAALIGRYASLPAPGLVRTDVGLLSDEDGAAARLAFRLLLSAVGGREHLPDAMRARGLLDRLASAPGKGSLGAAVADRRKGFVYLHRELRSGWTGAALAAPGAVWDGRFRIAARGLPENTMVESIGKTLAAARAREFDRAAVPPALLRAALACEPIVHVRKAERSLERHSPADGESLLSRVPAPYVRFLPSFDLAPAEALRRLFDADDFPASPWDSHNAA